MKKLVLLFVALFAFVFTSCSKDDENPSDSIVGKWYLYSKTHEGKTELKKYECENKDYIEFTSNGKAISCEYESENNCNKEIKNEGTYVFKDDKLIITEGKEKFTRSITIKGDVFETNVEGELLTYKRLK